MIRFQTWQRILDAAPDRFALAGLSMGGYVCMEIMRQAPERVERLALLDTSGRADSAEQNRRRRGLIELAKIGKFKGVTPAYADVDSYRTATRYCADHVCYRYGLTRWATGLFATADRNYEADFAA